MEYQLDTRAVLFAVTGDLDSAGLTPPLAMAYVPMQQWDCYYEDPMKSLCRGTIFPSLDKPFLEGACPNV